jgi:uncharacterized protein (TIGR00255 family)
MALKSMTGFGRARSSSENITITVEIQSVNSRQFDLNLRVPSYFKSAENEIRALLSKGVERGKIDCTIVYEWLNNERPAVFNGELIHQYFHDLQKATQGLSMPPETLFSAVMRLPEVTRQKNAEAGEAEIKVLVELVQSALVEFSAFRTNEGAALEHELIERINQINQLRMQILSLSNERTQHIRNKILKAIEDLALVEQLNHDRFEQEMIYYLEKLDISEEQTRLKTHCDYFLQTIHENSPGRKLGFITQEIGREINTIGSKANHSGIQKLVVSMKDELEKIKEQIANIL